MLSELHCMMCVKKTLRQSPKSKSRYRAWYQSFSTARNTLDGMEAMRMIQKDQIRHVGKDVVKQNNFVRSLFGLAA